MLISRKINKGYVIDFTVLEDYHDLEKIVEILTNKYQVEVIEKLDGPESRVWYLKLNHILISLHNNPYGNYLKDESKESIIFLKSNFTQLKLLFYTNVS